jgi:hypothetical protein
MSVERKNDSSEMQISHLEFQQVLRNGLWDTWKSALIVFGRQSFIVNEYG